jgi:hypothetical protein
MRTVLAALLLTLLPSLALADASQLQYSDVKAFLAKLVADNPKTTQLFTLGQTDSGDIVQGVQIGNGPVHNLIVGTHHGNEYGATEVAKAFAQSIATNPIDGQTVFVIPVLNIGGYNEKNREEIATAGDNNSHDPNRDYPGPCGTEGPHALKSTKLLADFIDKQNIVSSGTLHTFYPAVVYPWGIPTQDLSTQYDDIFKQLVAAATQESGYQTGNSTQVIYPAIGCYEDYAFWKHGIWSLLWELGTSHTPTDDEITNMIAVNVPGMRRSLEQAPKTRAANHDFTGKCDQRLFSRDRHDE